MTLSMLKVLLGLGSLRSYSTLCSIFKTDIELKCLLIKSLGLPRDSEDSHVEQLESSVASTRASTEASDGAIGQTRESQPGGNNWSTHGGLNEPATAILS